MRTRLWTLIDRVLAYCGPDRAADWWIDRRSPGWSDATKDLIDDAAWRYDHQRAGRSFLLCLLDTWYGRRWRGATVAYAAELHDIAAATAEEESDWEDPTEEIVRQVDEAARRRDEEFAHIGADALDDCDAALAAALAEFDARFEDLCREYRWDLVLADTSTMPALVGASA